MERTAATLYLCPTTCERELNLRYSTPATVVQDMKTMLSRRAVCTTKKGEPPRYDVFDFTCNTIGVVDGADVIDLSNSYAPGTVYLVDYCALPTADVHARARFYHCVCGALVPLLGTVVHLTRGPCCMFESWRGSDDVALMS